MNWIAINGTNATIANQINNMATHTSSSTGSLPILAILLVLGVIIYWMN